jgi:hypothetical protein
MTCSTSGNDDEGAHQLTGGVTEGRVSVPGFQCASLTSPLYDCQRHGVRSPVGWNHVISLRSGVIRLTPSPCAWIDVKVGVLLFILPLPPAALSAGRNSRNNGRGSGTSATQLGL